MKYSSATAFRRALTDKAIQLGIEHQRWFRLVAFERFLARLFAPPSPHWVLKGGYVLELRLRTKARTTKDLDLSVPPPVLENLLETLQETAARDLGDFFDFRIQQGFDLQGAPEGGSRFAVEAFLDGKLLVRFAVDIGQGDTHSLPLEHLPAQVDFSFAALEPSSFPSYPIEDHFAEKLHAYTRPREHKTRVKDLLDMALLIQLGVSGTAHLLERIEIVFATYNTHPLPNPIPMPPEEWGIQFTELAKNLGLQPTDMTFWLERIRKVLDPEK